ncbi:hypothetical protein HOLleu_01505 [Holothuria leucospilota]|uniref:Uncharacterized protein n=1 Tax=Holothuria leucospilota TaxID=206669 RepID=A0A9Q1HKW2_HOLLE|nr:hypothetical protein HOLleu_01505 [Holothuria leucospilota]
MAINVLVSFGTENRIVTVTSSTSIIASIRSIFRIPTDYTVNLQRYSKEWEDWVAINPEELENREKVRVTTPVSVDLSSATSKGFEESLGDLFEPITDSSNSQDDAPQSSQSDQNSDVKTVTERVKVELKPWPVQVKIPLENFSPQFRITLESGIFPCDKLRKQLIQILYDYMWQFGR